jgi:hypothetical protein
MNDALAEKGGKKWLAKSIDHARSMPPKARKR